MKAKVVRILINVLNFKNKKGFNKLMEQICPMIMFCKQFSYLRILINTAHGQKYISNKLCSS